MKISNIVAAVVVANAIGMADIQANDAMDMMEKLEVRQKVRTHTEYNGGDEHVRRRSARGQDCNVNLGSTYVEERRGGREVNVYTYADDVSVECE